MSKDPRVDAYIAKSADFAKPILKHLRRVVHKGCPRASETLKWGVPAYEYEGEILCLTSASMHPRVMLWTRTNGVSPMASRIVSQILGGDIVT